MALTLIKQHQAFILEATSVPDICERFKEITRGGFVTECHAFMQVGVRPPPGLWPFQAHPLPELGPPPTPATSRPLPPVSPSQGAHVAGEPAP